MKQGFVKPEGYYQWSEEKKARYRKSSTKPSTIPDFVRTFKRKLNLRDGTQAQVVIGYPVSGTPIWDEDDPDHYDDHKWLYPVKGDAFIVSGRSDALELECDHVTYSKARRANG